MFGYDHYWYVDKDYLIFGKVDSVPPPENYYLHANGDTVINSKFYFKAETSPFDSTIFFREDTQSEKVWLLTKDTTKEILIYDFSLNKDDSIDLHFDFPDSLGSEKILSGYYHVDSVVDISIPAGVRKAIFLSNPLNTYDTLEGESAKPELEWIEQIGSTVMPDYLRKDLLSGGLATCPYWPFFYVLTCSFSDSFEQYHNNDSMLCLPYLPFDSCAFDHGSGVNYINKNDLILNLSPDPADETVTLSAQLGIPSSFEMIIYNEAGMTVKEISGTSTNELLNKQINISSLAPGIYLVRLITDKGFGIKKFVKE
jgi:hypothetical protein